MNANGGNPDAKISLTAGEIKITNETRNGIYNASTLDIDINSEKGDFVLTSTGNGDDLAGIKNTGTGKTSILAKGDLKVDAKNNTYGMYVTNGNVNASSYGLTAIQGGKDGIYLTNGSISISSGVGESINTLSLDAKSTEEGTNIVVVGEENGIDVISDGESTLSLTANENNFISGEINAIYSHSSDESIVPEININAVTGSNYIGFDATVTDDDGIEYIGKIGQNGINVSSGKVNLTAGNENKIAATEKGIKASGANSQFSLVSNKNTITVINEDSNTSYISGIELSNQASVKISKNNNISSFADDGTYITVKGTGSAYGIYSSGTINTISYPSGSLSLESSGLYIDVSGASSAGKHTVAGIYWEGDKSSKLSINTGEKGINIISTVKGMEDGNNNSGTSYAFKQYSTLDTEVKTTGDLLLKSTIDGFSTESTSLYTTANDSSNSVEIEAKSIDIYAENKGVNTKLSSNTYGIQALKDENSPEDATNLLNITATDEDGYINIVAKSESQANSGNVFGINVSASTVNLTSNLGSVNITSTKSDNSMLSAAIFSAISPSLFSQFSLLNISTRDGAYLKGDDYVIYSAGKSKTTIDTKNGTNYLVSDGNGYGIANMSGANVEVLSHEGSNFITDVSTGIYSAEQPGYEWEEQKFSTTTLTAKGVTESNNVINSAVNGIYAANSLVTLHSTNGINSIAADTGYAAFASSASINLNAGTANLVGGSTFGIASGSGVVSLIAGTNNVVTSTAGKAVYAYTNSDIDLKADQNNLITAGATNVGEKGTFANNFAVDAESGSSVLLQAQDTNQLLGAVYATGNGTSVDIQAANNTVNSYAYISGAGGLTDEKIISALYAQGEGAKITLDGNNSINTYAVSESPDLERVVWAYNGADIEINGQTAISTDRYQENRDNSKDISVVAGTSTGLEKKTYEEIMSYDGPVAHVNVNYEGNSSITGDVLAAYAGEVNVKKEGASGSMNVTGNLLAGNNGVLNVDLGDGGTLTGRVDDYGDAGVLIDTSHGNGLFNPAFSSKIISGGQVNLTMGEGARWELTGQSWITNINTSTAAISKNSPVIDLVNSNTDRNTAAHALTVYSMNGNAVFNMSLDGNRDVSDMLYVKKATGEYLINVIDPVSNDDMYAAESALASGRYDGLRFATVGAGSNASFRAVTVDQGVIDVEYEVGTDSYHNNEENVHYNGDALDTQKPGDTTVDTFFNTDGTPGEAVGVEENTPETQALAASVKMAKAVSEEAVAEKAEAKADSGLDEVTNFKLIGRSEESISDGGKTIINMSRANYANAVYMDTLNKRQGEARFVSDTDHGVWVRLRHDNIGKEDSFRSHNTMVEVGIDQRDVHDYGEFHTGVALDYMNGSLDYHTVDGDGDIERYGIWFYTTYLGNDGQYADLILKYGHLKNDFGFNTKTQGEHVTGDYTNESASISAEYGWKFSNSHNYYIEPQAQLQYTYITGADYTTSQGSRVDLDSIHSLIGRVGFRAGKDFLDWEHPASFYLRADALHEFLGDQDIRAYDNTGVMDVTYENDDTWYTVGLGMTVKSSDNTYFFIEGETALGADNEDTYTVSGGFRHSF
ncbi:autotransporter outer membrane beta-barrel domain-containing protein [Succinatimonas hippei]|uniref:autotransporter outer membrane beta-barrel domain-containing protein n=1 Tax=Succinatimonas hippei TaxID=626938 RepID=UPI0020125FE1|nr:autotransporter outer membrane beta-barrel domain-containing protein [Succinatimonas hippei]MCL1604109.1 autotransporter outer membrane beta-barrel domain-containing protein [Succinatimonas hippei]